MILAQVLCLKKLPNLKSVYGKAMRFPDVCRIFVSKCPELKKLTLDFERAGQGKSVETTSMGGSSNSGCIASVFQIN
ncbi:hypothetical protein CUMW_258750 [Citrus unshiu]|uniref:Uncharacterized protein n=1 Tax=Citrus unshiu TaxID=55188 RepID=A0A2H5QSW4_CITUN|nr:hypothetical protein CUMW_258750 [Citrus unshiu]